MRHGRAGTRYVTSDGEIDEQGVVETMDLSGPRTYRCVAGAAGQASEKQQVHSALISWVRPRPNFPGFPSQQGPDMSSEMRATSRRETGSRSLNRKRGLVALAALAKFRMHSLGPALAAATLPCARRLLDSGAVRTSISYTSCINTTATTTARKCLNKLSRTGVFIPQSS